MKKLIPAYIRIPAIFALVFLAVEFVMDSGEEWAVVKYPLITVFLILFLFLLIAIEVIVAAIDRLIYNMLTDEQKQKLQAKETVPLAQSIMQSSWLSKLTKSKEIENEDEVMLEHDYDGIKELDNVLPPWWVGLFYVTIVFGLIYIVRFHIINEYDQASEFETEMAVAQAEVEKYKRASPEVFNFDAVEMLTDAADLEHGRKIYESSCAACHKSDGGGAIGPNLTDEYWILGGGIKNVFNTIMDGGREGKGMVPWKNMIKPADIQKIASYVMTLQGTNPAEAKAPEGDKYVAENINVPNEEKQDIKDDTSENK